MDSNVVDFIPFINLSNEDLNNLFSEDHVNENINFDIEELNLLHYSQDSVSNISNTDDYDHVSDYFDHTNINLNCKYYFEDELNSKTDNVGLNESNSLSLFCHNINSMVANFDTLWHQCLDRLKFKFSILGFVETKLTSEIVNQFEITSYEQFTLNNTRRKGGIALYAYKSYKS